MQKDKFSYFNVLIAILLFIMILLFPHLVNDYEIGTIRGYKVYILDLLILLFFCYISNIKFIFELFDIKSLRNFKISVICWFIYLLINALYSILYRGNALNNVMGYLRTFLLYTFIIIIILKSSLQNKVQQNLIYLIGLLISIYSFYNYITGRGYRDESFSFVLHPEIDTRRYISYIYGTILFLPLNLIIYEWFFSKISIKKTFLIFLIVSALIFSNYRTIWINIIFTFFLWLFLSLILRKSKRINYMINFIVIVSLLFFLVIIINNYLNYWSIVNVKLNTIGLMIAYNTRIMLLNSALYAFKQSPFVGVGLGYRDPYDLFTTHNDIIQLLRDIGIIGLILFSILIISSIHLGIKVISYKKLKMESIPYIFTILNSVVTSCFQPFFIQRIGYAFLMLILALIIKQTNYCLKE